MTTEEDLRRVVETAYVHCRPGGSALFAPDHVRETFRPQTSHGGHDDGPRGLRYLQWTWDPDPNDSTYRADFAYLLREADGTVRAEQDLHIGGLFPRQTWLDLLRGPGFDPRVLPFEHSEVEPGTGEFYLAIRHASRSRS